MLQTAVGTADGYRPLGAQTPVYVASLSKQFTAAAVYKLAAEGRIRLKEPIGVRLRGLSSPTSTPSVQQLLNHTSGLRDYSALLEVAGRLNERPDNRGVLRILNAQRALNFAPGTDYEYSNSDYVLLGLLVEEVTGLPLSTFMEPEFFAPLAMKDSWFGTTKATREEPARGYTLSDGAWHPSDPPPSTGDGGMYSSVSDLLRWLQEVTKPNLAAHDPLRQIQLPARLISGARLPHASGLFLGRYKGRATLSHNGAVAGFQADLVHFPRERISVVCLCNRGDVDAASLSREVADVYLGAGAARPRAPGRPRSSEAAGVWESAQGFVLTTKVEGGILSASLGGEAYTLSPVGKSAMFTTGSSTFPMVLRLRGPNALDFGVEGDRFERFRRIPPALNPLPIAVYGGDFVNTEMNLSWHLLVENGVLVLTTAAGWRIPFTYVAPDRFEVGPWLIRFERDQSGITALLLHRQRAWNLRFQRQ